MIFYILDTLNEANVKFVENLLKAKGKEEDYVIEKVSASKLNQLNDDTRPTAIIGGELQGVIFYEE